MTRVFIIRFTFIQFFLLIFLSKGVFAGDVSSNLKFMNGGFERLKDGKPEYWYRFGPEGSAHVNDEVRIEGRYSLKINLSEGLKNGVRLVQSVEVEAGKRYDFGGAIKTSLEDGSAGIMVTFLDKHGTEIETKSLPEMHQSNSWSYQNQWIKSPDGADIAKITCFAKGKGAAWFDDLHFTTKIRGGY